MSWSAWLYQFFGGRRFFDGITLLALVGALKFLVEYVRDNRRKRLELYNKLRDEFRTNSDFTPIFEFLEAYEVSDEQNKKILARDFTSSVRLDTRSEFAAFLEDIAMTMKSGALKGRVANYMFGYYAIICWENEPFWSDGLRQSEDDPYWALLKNFVWRMKIYRKILEFAPQLVVFSLKV